MNLFVSVAYLINGTAINRPAARESIGKAVASALWKFENPCTN